MGILSISMNGIYITLGVVIFLTLVGAINSLAECLNRRHNDGGESPNTFENITQSADARPRKLNIRHSLTQRTGRTTIKPPENLNEIELSPAAEDIDSGDKSLRKIGTSNKTNFHPTLSSAMRYDASSDEEDYGSPAILSSETDASGTPEVDPKALIVSARLACQLKLFCPPSGLFCFVLYLFCSPIAYLFSPGREFCGNFSRFWNGLLNTSI